MLSKKVKVIGFEKVPVPIFLLQIRTWSESALFCWIWIRLCISAADPEPKDLHHFSGFGSEICPRSWIKILVSSSFKKC